MEKVQDNLNTTFMRGQLRLCDITTDAKYLNLPTSTCMERTRIRLQVMISELKALLDATACVTTYNPALHPELKYHHGIDTLPPTYKQLQEFFPGLNAKSNPETQD